MFAFQDLTGQKFTRLLVIKSAKSIGNGTRWLCQCDCGSKKVIRDCHLRNGSTQSCGCWRRERATAANITHGATRHGQPIPEWTTWASMNQRCENPKRKDFKNYGGRGITVCEEWRHSFPAFFAHIGPKPSPKHTLDRYPNNDGNYEPGNVRWATYSEQNRNKRRHHKLYLKNRGK
jgi:hypothetical protein